MFFVLQSVIVSVSDDLYRACGRVKSQSHHLYYPSIAIFKLLSGNNDYKILTHSKGYKIFTALDN